MRRPSSGVHEPWYYHSKQNKIMRMEAEDAFRLRGIVLVALAVVVATGTAAALYSLGTLTSSLLRWSVALCTPVPDYATDTNGSNG
ncbi:hypothetical protein MY11210_009359 [Beauveria gryllotalpidicola]